MLHDSSSQLEILEHPIKVVVELLDRSCLSVRVPVLMVVFVLVVVMVVGKGVGRNGRFCR